MLGISLVLTWRRSRGRWKQWNKLCASDGVAGRLSSFPTGQKLQSGTYRSPHIQMLHSTLYALSRPLKPVNSHPVELISGRILLFFQVEKDTNRSRYPRTQRIILVGLKDSQLKAPIPFSMFYFVKFYLLERLQHLCEPTAKDSLTFLL